MNRRKFVAAVGAGCLGAVAGCTASADSGIGDGGEAEVPASVGWPEVTTETPGWKLASTEEDQVRNSSVVTVYARTHKYEHERLRREIREKTLGQFDSTIATFFATHMGLRGLGTGLASVDKLVEPVGNTLKTEMEKFGLRNVRDVPVGDVTPEIEDARLREFRAEFEVPPIEKTVNLSDLPEKTFTIPSQKCPTPGSWPSGRTRPPRRSPVGACFPPRTTSSRRPSR